MSLSDLHVTDFHLALEAVVAYVDGELSPSARARAEAHVGACRQCSSDVAAQREAKGALRGAGGPDLPGDLLTRLCRIPFTTELQPPGMTLAMHGEQLLWSRSVPADTVPVDRSAVDTAPAVSPPLGAAPVRVPNSVPPSTSTVLPTPGPPDRRSPGRPTGPTAPKNRSSSVRLRRFRRGLIGAVAGLAAGVLATSVAPVAVIGGVGTAQNRTVQDRVGPPELSASLVSSVSDVMEPRDFSGSATGLR